jgi:tRNA threonylcarbamoyladenosine modification (KEOPS) complex  Pcc1 subunit
MNYIINKIKNKFLKENIEEEIEGQFLNTSDFKHINNNIYSVSLDRNFSSLINNSILNINLKLTTGNTRIELKTDDISRIHIFIENSLNSLKIKSNGKINKYKNILTLLINEADISNLNSITNKSSSIINGSFINFDTEEFEFNIFGSGELLFEEFKANFIKINSKNNGKIVFQSIEAENITLNATKSFVVKFKKGSSNNIDINLQDTSKLIAKEFNVKFANINLNTTGNVIINIIDNVKGSISGIGNLHLLNKSVNIDVRMTGLGSVKFK